MQKGLALSPVFVSKTLQIQFMTLNIEMHQDKSDWFELIYKTIFMAKFKLNLKQGLKT